MALISSCEPAAEKVVDRAQEEHSGTASPYAAGESLTIDQNRRGISKGLKKKWRIALELPV